MNNFRLPLEGSVVDVYPNVPGVVIAGEGTVTLQVGGRIETGTSKHLGKFVIITYPPLGIAFRFYGLEEVLVESGKYSKKGQALATVVGLLQYDIVRLRECRARHVPLTFPPEEGDSKIFVNPLSIHLDLVGKEVLLTE